MLRTSFIAGFAVAALLGATPFVIPADHMKKLKTMKVAPRTTTEHYRRAQ